MERPNRPLPWWLRYLTPSALFFLPAYLIVIGITVAVLLPLIAWLSR